MRNFGTHIPLLVRKSYLEYFRSFAHAPEVLVVHVGDGRHLGESGLLIVGVVPAVHDFFLILQKIRCLFMYILIPGAMELNLSFGDKGWEDSEFHTDLLEGQEDFLQFPDDEYRVDLSHVAEDDLAIIIASEPEKLRTSTARSLSTIFTDEPTTSLSSSTELENSSTLSSTEVLEPESLFSSVVTAAETSQENEVDNDDEPVVQALNVQDPENKATEIHNDILIKLREQLRKFMT